MKKAPWTTMLPPPVAKQRKWLRSASKKRQKQLAQYRKLRQEFLANRTCEVCGMAKATEVHHRQPRSVRPDRVTDVDNFVGVCSPCHRKITDNPAWAYRMGFLKKSWE